MAYFTKFYLPIIVFLAFGAAGCGDDTKDTGEREAAPVAAFTIYDDVHQAFEAGVDVREGRKLLIDNYARVSDPATNRVDPAASREYIDLANRLAEENAGDTLAALPLYKAAEIHQALGDYNSAADIFGRIYGDYPSFSKSGEALFMQAFTYDENLEDYPKAKSLYEEFLAKYPDNTFADDTEMLLKNLGKSDEEMLRSLGQ